MRTLADTSTVDLVLLTREQLAALVEQAVQRALDQYVAAQPAPERLLKSSEMAERIGVCESQLGNLCREGCPHVLVGDRQRRFEPEAVLAWLRERTGASDRPVRPSFGTVRPQASAAPLRDRDD